MWQSQAGKCGWVIWGFWWGFWLNCICSQIYSLEDVNKELTEGQVVLNGTHDNVRAFFQSHPNYHVCKDDEAFTVAVIRNRKVDKHADDQYVVANYNRDGTIGAMEVGPPQFSVGNLASYCN